jgi:hypothetical protein
MNGFTRWKPRYKNNIKKELPMREAVEYSSAQKLRALYTEREEKR